MFENLTLRERYDELTGNQDDNDYYKIKHMMNSGKENLKLFVKQIIHCY